MGAFALRMPARIAVSTSGAGRADQRLRPYMNRRLGIDGTVETFDVIVPFFHALSAETDEQVPAVAHRVGRQEIRGRFG